MNKCNLIEPLNVGLMFFNERPDNFFRYARIEVVDKPDPTGEGMTDDDLKNRKLVSKRYRNRRIGDFLKELHMVEGRNTEIPTILKAMSANGSSLPVFETDEERSYMTVVLPVHEKFIDESQNDEHVSNGGKTEQRRRSKGELRDYVLSLLKEHEEMSASEIVHSLGYKTVSNTLRNVFKELVCEDLIEYTIPEKMNSRKQKLRLKRK